jgi:hypothetical protein
MRKCVRKAVDEPVRLHPNTWSSVEVRLIDCSEAGFRAECDVRIRVRDEVTLELPGMDPATAYVIWSNGREFGARFAVPMPIDRAELTAAAPQQVLARLLVQRAAAQKSRLWDQEERLRREIGQALPIQRAD